MSFSAEPSGSSITFCTLPLPHVRLPTTIARPWSQASSLEDTYALFTGGRAISENLQLDRTLLAPDAPESASSDRAEDGAAGCTTLSPGIRASINRQTDTVTVLRIGKVDIPIRNDLIDKTWVENLEGYVPKNKQEEEYLKKGWVIFEGNWMSKDRRAGEVLE